MKKYLPSFLCFCFGTLFLLSLSTGQAKAQGEDSCHAMMNVMPDNNDPLLVHFQFIGMVPINSFQFLGSWDFGDGYTSSDSCPDHQYAAPGTYIVCLSFNICIGGGMSCHDDTCESITIGSLAGLASTDGRLHSFYTYPNPVMTELFLRSDAQEAVILDIRDLEGQVVMHAIVKNDESIDVSTLANGIYFAEATDGTHLLKRKLVIHH